MTTINNIANLTVSPAPSITLVSYGCLILHYEDFLPWDDPENVISAKTEDLVRRWKGVTFMPILFLIGAPANVINMAVFYRQGLKERINVCLFALSLADFLYLIFTFIFKMEDLQFDRKEIYSPIYSFIINHNLGGFYGFTWVSQILSAIIASERCFCILRPLRAHSFLRASTTTAIIIVVNVTVVGLYFLVAFRYRTSCVFDPVKQVSFVSLVPGLFYLKHKKLIEYLDTFVYGVGLPNIMMVVVAVTTVITTVKLREAAAWRAETSSRASLSNKEIALTKMLVCNSVLFMVCVFPISLFRFTWLFLPDMNVGGKQHNLFLVGFWLLDILSWINSTFNFLIYYLMGSRYRATLWQLVGRNDKAVSGKTVA